MDEFRSGRIRLVLCIVFGAACLVAIVSFVVITSGVLARDRMTLRIAAQGTDTLVVIGDHQLLLRGMAWPSPPAALLMLDFVVLVSVPVVMPVSSVTAT